MVRYLACFALAFSGAVLAWVSHFPWWLLILGTAGAGVLPVLFLRKKNGRIRSGIILAGILLGFGWCSFYDRVICAPAYELAGETVRFSGYAADYARETDYGSTAELFVRTEEGRRVRALAYFGEETPLLMPGDRVEGIAAFRRADVRRGETDLTYPAQGIFLLASVKTAEVTGAEGIALSCIPQRIRREMQEMTDILFPEEESAFFRAILTGDRGELSHSVWQSFSRIGTAHVLAVSGLHIGFLVGMFGIFGNRRRRALITIPVLLAYVLITGASPSVCRAAVMAGLALLAPVFHRESDGITSLSAALLLLLLQNPYAAAGVSLQLSFGAMAGILCFGEKLKMRLTPKRFEEPPTGRTERYLLRPAAGFVSGGLALTLAASVFTLPVMVWYFQSVSLIFIAANLLMVWAVSLCFSFALPAVVLGCLWLPLGRILAVPARFTGSYILKMTEWMGDFPYARISLGSRWGLFWFIAVLILVYLFIFVPDLRRRPILPLGSVTVLVVLALGMSRMDALTAPLSVSVLDVGQGSCTLFASRGCAAAVDCGGSEGNAGDILADRLNAAGETELELLILTHYDSDHTNGVEQLFARLDVGTLILPDTGDDSGRREEILAAAREHGTAVYWVYETTQLLMGDVKLTLFPPAETGTDNEAGLCVLCTGENFDALITGDISAETEELLLQRERLPQLELLVAGHHGAAGSTGEALLAALTPETVVISVGYNPYGHPDAETLTRLAFAGCRVLRTDTDGTVTLRCG